MAIGIEKVRLNGVPTFRQGKTTTDERPGRLTTRHKP